MAITPITKKRILFGDVSRKTNEEAIKESIRNLILTDNFEKPFQPEFGANIRGLLFENIQPETFRVVKEMIKNVIEANEPRAELLGVDVFGKTDSNVINIIITFNVINREEPVTLEILLNRIR